MRRRQWTRTQGDVRGALSPGRRPGCENTLEIRRYYVLYVLIYITYNTQGYYAKDTLVVYSYYTLYRYLSVYACMHPALSGMAHVLARAGSDALMAVINGSAESQLGDDGEREERQLALQRDAETRLAGCCARLGLKPACTLA